jgi:hypothetical protein
VAAQQARQQFDQARRIDKRTQEGQRLIILLRGGSFRNPTGKIQQGL